MSNLARLRLPDSARRGDLIEVRLLIQHDMETGFRRDMQGRAVPLNVIQDVRVMYGGEEVFRAELGSGVSANPYLAFPLRVEAGGEVLATWVDTAGARGSISATLNVA